MGTITLTDRDRTVLHLLAAAPASSEQLAGSLAVSPADLTERLEELAENGLVREQNDGTYALTESGSRILETSEDSSTDSRIDAPHQLREAITELDLRPEQEVAVFTAVAFLRYWGAVSESELIDGIYSEHPAGYETADEWWQEFMKETLAGLPKIEPPTDDTDSWEYTGAAEITEHTEDGRKLFADPTQTYGSVKHALETLDLPTEQHTAVHTVFAVLRDETAVAETELKRIADERIDPEMPTDAWWSRRIEPVLQKLPGIERGEEQTWQYTGGVADSEVSDISEYDETPPVEETTTETEASERCPVCHQPYDGRTHIEASETRVSGWDIPICIKATTGKRQSGTNITLYYHETTDGRG